jgi:hypothetical protein
MSRLQQSQRLTLHGSAISIEEELGPGIFLARDSKGLPTLVDGKFYRGNVWVYDTSGPYYGARVAVDRDRTPYKKLTFRTVRGGEAALIREARRQIETATAKAARAAGWNHGGDNGGFWYDARQFDSWKAAASAEDAACYATAADVCRSEGIDL